MYDEMAACQELNPEEEDDMSGEEEEEMGNFQEVRSIRIVIYHRNVIMR